MQSISLQAVSSLVLWVGLIGLLVSWIAFLAAAFHVGFAKGLMKLVDWIGFLATILIILMVVAGSFGYRVTLGDLLDSLRDSVRGSYSRVLER
jgi:hypothetical protein